MIISWTFKVNRLRRRRMKIGITTNSNCVKGDYTTDGYGKHLTYAFRNDGRWAVKKWEIRNTDDLNRNMKFMENDLITFILNTKQRLIIFQVNDRRKSIVFRNVCVGKKIRYKFAIFMPGLNDEITLINFHKQFCVTE